MEEWLTAAPVQTTANATNPSRNRYSLVPSDATTAIIKKVLFPEFDRSGRRDNALRYLDQSWRLRHKDEVFLFGRIARAEQPAEELTTAGTSPSRLWLGSLPAMGQPRPPLTGTLAQETYVRMIVQVRTTE